MGSVAVEASRAYPHGCLYRHPSYYTYDERDDISWATTIPTTEPLCDHDDELLENDTEVSLASDNNNQVAVEPPFLDFRKLPPKSSRLRRPYDRYRLTRRLGAGKFSDVFEAVDVQWEDKSKKAVADKKRRKKRMLQQQKQRTRSTRHKQDEGEGSSSSSSSGERGGIKHGKCGESTEEAEEHTKEESDASENGSKSKQEGDNNNGGIDPQSLVVLKCLKPVSERKIRRELLVLTHCLTLPNLARVIGIVLPDSMDVDDDNENENNVEYSGSTTIREAEKEGILQQQQQQQEEIDVTASGGHHKRRRRQQPSSSSNRLQWENIGSITDAAASTVEVARPTSRRANTSTTATTVSSSSTKSTTKNSSSNTNNNNKQQHQHQHQTKPKPKQQKNHGTQLPALVLEHAGQKAQWFCHGNTNDSNYLSEYEMKYYLCHLLIALDGLHAAGIMHRDVKPRNTLINRFANGSSGSRNNVNGELMSSSSAYNFDSDGEQIVTTTSSTFSMSQQQQIIDPLPPPALMLLDLGLADFYLPGKEYNVRVASRHYKSPELLIGFEYYDYAIDMWSVGCILAGLLFRREPFFRGKDNEDQLGKIVSVLGTRDFLPYCRKCNVRLSSKARAAIGKYCSRAASSSSSSSDGATSLLNNEMGRRKPWLSFLSPTCPIPSPEALDLLDKLLVYDHEQRWTAREALGHSFFDDVRDQVLREVQERAVHESHWRNNVLVQRR